MNDKNVTDLKKIYRTVNKGEFPDQISLELKKEFDLRYGENPNQPGAIYSMKETTLPEFTNIRLAKTGKSGLSATNTMDVARALDILKFFDKPAVSIMKHLIPSGFAVEFVNNSLKEIYKNARDADARSAFGSVVVFNRKIDEETATEIASTFVEGVAAPGFSKEAFEIFEGKKNLRLIVFDHLDKIPKYIDDDTTGLFDIKMMPTGRLVLQKPYLCSIKTKDDLVFQPFVTDESEVEHKVSRIPDEQELDDLLTSWYINLGIRSNGVVIVKNGVTLAVGSGQQERVGAVEQAIMKAYQKAMDRAGIEYDTINLSDSISKLSENPLQGAVLSSDGFFPFRDSIDLISSHGIKAVIQPGGSIKDHVVIDAVNEHNMSMIFTLERCFGHF